nr:MULTISPECIES: M23 family metallopeptidase [unclassified Paenibacillus]
MKFKLTSPFGVFEEIRDGRAHNGIDLAMPEGTQLRSIVDGVVEKVVDYGAQNIGKGVIIRTDDGTQLIYGHMEKVSVRPGDHVDVGEFIGLSGNTGHSTGPHLHFGMMKDGEYIDPTPLADTIAKMSGKHELWKGPLWQLGEHAKGLITGAVESAQEAAIEAMKHKIFTFLHAAGEVLLDMSYGVTLVGCAVLIILKVAGLLQGYRWASILFTVNALLRLVLGGALK